MPEYDPVTEVDITPHPRILRMLGEIAFEPQKCIGELIDNAIDGFLKRPQLFAGDSSLSPEISITVPHRDQAASGAGEIVVEDNGPGMTLSELTDAAKAGFSGSSPTDNLGLFGMGFNIATARLGGVTELRSGVIGENAWSVIDIDLAGLQRSASFAIRPRFENKASDIHGTRVTVRQLKPEQAIQIAAGVRGPTRRSVVGLREWIGRTYTRYLRLNEPRLGGKSLRVVVNGGAVQPYRWCVWSGSRYVEVGASTRHGAPEQIEAYQEFDLPLGAGLFCVVCLSWQPQHTVPGGQCVYCRDVNVVERIRRMKGWLGVQRHLDEEKYGIDFLRNGRAILQWDKRVFSWEDPDSGRVELEYPIDEPRARHGRIVGELEIDHVPVHYQKDSFEEESWLWREVIDNLRGRSPLRPQVAQRRNLPRNESLLQPIYKGFNRTRTEEGGRSNPGQRRRREKWSKDLIINQDVALDYYEKFVEGEPDFQTDEKWYEWMVDADAAMERASGEPTEGVPPVIASPRPATETPRTERQRLRDEGELDGGLSGTYGFEPHRVLEVSVYRLDGSIFREQGTMRHAVPVLAFPELQGTVDCFYDETHPRVEHEELDVRDLVIAEVALILRERFYDRLPYSFVLDHLRMTRLPDLSRANLTRSALRLIDELWPRFVRAFEAHPAAESLRDLLGDEDVRSLARAIAEEGGSQDRVEQLLNSGEFLRLMPHQMSRILRRVPEAFMDDLLFAIPYVNLPRGLTEAEQSTLGQDNVSRVANPLEDLANATRPSRFDAPEVERNVRLRAFRSLDLIREFLVAT